MIAVGIGSVILPHFSNTITHLLNIKYQLIVVLVISPFNIAKIIKLHLSL